MEKIYERRTEMKNFIFVVAIILCLFFHSNLSFAQKVNPANVDQIWVPSVTIFDQDTIGLILEDLMIPEENPSQIDIIDINKNGFGEKDILRVFYLEQDSLRLSDVFFMDRVSDAIREILHGYEFNVNVRLDAANMSQMEYEDNKDPFYAILGALAEGLQRNYQDYESIKIGFKRDVDGVTMEFWGYDQSKIKFHPVEDRQNIFCIYTTVRDSVIVGEE